MSDEINMLKQRISALELAVGRMKYAMGGMSSSIELAQKLPAACSHCEHDPEQVENCGVPNCPQGKSNG